MLKMVSLLAKNITGEGLYSVEVVPFPKSQITSSGEPMEVLKNWAVKGVQPSMFGIPKSAIIVLETVIVSLTMEIPH